MVFIGPSRGPFIYGARFWVTVDGGPISHTQQSGIHDFSPDSRADHLQTLALLCLIHSSLLLQSIGRDQKVRHDVIL